METLYIKGIEYSQFENMRDRMFAEENKGLVSAEYSKHLRVVKLVFWDSKYIPDFVKMLPDFEL